MGIADVEKEITESKTEEKNAQEEYDTMMKESGEKRRMDSKTLSDKESAKADLEKALQQMAKEEKTTKFEVMNTAETLKDLHLECDWLLNNFEAKRKHVPERSMLLRKQRPCCQVQIEDNAGS